MADFFKDLNYGQDGEKLVGHWLTIQNVVHLPLYQFSVQPTAPLIEGRSRTFSCPDFLCWQGDQHYFVECKRRSDWIRFDGREEFGLELDKHLDYLHLSTVTSTKLYYYFLHDSDGIFSGEVGALNLLRRDALPYVNFARTSLSRILAPDDHTFHWGWPHGEDKSGPHKKQLELSGAALAHEIGRAAAADFIEAIAKTMRY